MYIHQNTIQPVDLKATTGSTGRFYTTPRGDVYPSVTTMLGYGNKKWLEDWKQSLGPLKAATEIKRATDRGTDVHSMVEILLQNQSLDLSRYSPAHVHEFKTLRLYLRNINNILLQESALYSDILRLAGRVDCVAEYDGVLSIIDFKTSSRDKHEHMIQDYYLQTTAYALMIEELYGICIEQLIIIMSTEKGIMPMLFKQKTENFIVPLLERVDKYYKSIV